MRRTAAESFEHDAVPFDRVVGAIGANRGPSEPPFIQGWFAHMHRMITPPDLPGVDVEYELFDSENSRFDLSLIVDETAAGTFLYFEYDEDLFARGTVERIAELYQSVLRRSLEEPDAKLSDLRAQVAEAMARDTPGPRRASRFQGLKSARRGRTRSASKEKSS